LKPDLKEIEQALKDRHMLTLERTTIIGWITYTRELEAKVSVQPKEYQPVYVQAGETIRFVPSGGGGGGKN
jgi:hypothetical protein